MMGREKKQTWGIYIRKLINMFSRLGKEYGG
jgi:hypothetical protein